MNQFIIIPSQTIHTVCPPPIAISATCSVKTPLVTSRSRIATEPVFCSATATRLPALLNANCRGNEPPAGKISTNDSVPFVLEIENEVMESDGGRVLLKVKSRRFEMMRVEPSGY